MNELRIVQPPATPGLMTRIMSRIGVSRGGRFVARHVGWKLDPVLLRLTRSRIATTVVVPTAVLETKGARTGARRRNAVIYFHDGDDAVIAASNAGAAHHPAWFHNLLADPDITFGGSPVRAEVVDTLDERVRLWALADRIFPGFAVYRRQAELEGREVPLIRLRTR